MYGTVQGHWIYQNKGLCEVEQSPGKAHGPGLAELKVYSKAQGSRLYQGTCSFLLLSFA